MSLELKAAQERYWKARLELESSYRKFTALLEVDRVKLLRGKGRRATVLESRARAEKCRLLRESTPGITNREIAMELGIREGMVAFYFSPKFKGNI